MKKLIADYLKGSLGAVSYILFHLAASSGFFTYRGASLDAETFLEKSAATVFAIASSAAIYLFWMVVIKIVPHLRSVRARLIAGLVIAVFCVQFALLSSVFNTSGLTGRDAQEVHVSRYVGELEGKVDVRFRQALIIEGVAADIRMEIARYKAKAEEEFKYGIYSGEPGPGAVTNTMGEIAGRLGELLKESNRFLGKVETHRKEAQDRLETIRKIAASERPLPRRMRDIARESDALRTELAHMNVGNVADSVSRTLASLPREVDLQARFSADPDIAVRQRDALERVRGDIRESGRVLGAFAEKHAAAPTPTVEPFEKISAAWAVIIYWRNYLPYWAGGIGLDLAPLSVVIFLAIALGVKSPAELARDRMLSMSVEDLMRAKLDEEALRRMGLDPGSLRDINNEVLGLEDKGNDRKKGDDQ